jgi:hypothetical protein
LAAAGAVVAARLVVTLDPDVAAVFTGAREAKDALRALAFMNFGND